MKQRFLFLVLLLCLSATAQSVIEYKNEQINVLDENGIPSGIWKLYDDDKKIEIVVSFKDGNSAETKYYRDSNFIADLKDNDVIEIYKDGQTFSGRFFRKEDKSQTIVDLNGKELNSEVLQYFSGSSQVYPMFYGGQVPLYEFVSRNINYNTIKNNKGKVRVKFVVNAVGKTSEIEVLDSTNPELNEEAKRVVGILPRWQPGHQGGAFVKCQFIIPININ